MIRSPARSTAAARLALSIAVLAAAFWSRPSFAAEVLWTGAAQDDDSWSTLGNWSGDRVPGDGDRARFDGDHVVRIDDVVRVGGISVSDGKFPVFQNDPSV